MIRLRALWIFAVAVLVVIALIPNWMDAQQPQRGGGRGQAAPADDALREAPPNTRLFAQDAYTEYGMLDDPNSNSFRIVFMPLETRAGATVLTNGTRHGSDGGDVSVWDPRTGKPLKFDYVDGVEAKKKLPNQNFTPEDHYIIAQLPWAVPEGGEGRVLIYKTYKDARTYYPKGPNDIVWVRALGGQRFAVILPKGYAFSSANIASQVMTLPDGRVKLALTNPSGGSSPITIHARKTNTPFVGNKNTDKVYDDVKTLYDLDDPGAHTFKIDQTYSDYRKGDKAKLDAMAYAPMQELKVIDLDTAKALPTMKDGNSTVAKLEVPIVDDKQSAHLKVTGKVTDPAYKVDNGDLLFDRTVHGLRNTILLPAGWDVAAVSQPCTLGMYQNRVFIALINIQAEDAVKVTVRARKRPSGSTQ